MKYTNKLIILISVFIFNACVNSPAPKIKNQKVNLRIVYLYDSINSGDANLFASNATKALNTSFKNSGINNIFFTKVSVQRFKRLGEISEYRTNPEDMLRVNEKNKKIFHIKKLYMADIVIFIKKTGFAIAESRLELRKTRPIEFVAGASKFRHDLKQDISKFSKSYREKLFLETQIVVNYNPSKFGLLTVIHEVGHLFGLDHGHTNNGIYYFAKGFAIKNKICSAMCYGKVTNSEELPLFSGPNVYYKGIRLGDENHNSVRAIKIIAPRLKYLTNSIND